MAEKNEMRILFPEEEVEGVKLRPWGLGQSVDLAPTIEKVVGEIQSRGIGLNQIEEKIDQLIFAIFPHVVEIIRVTTGLDEKEIRSWPMIKGTLIFLVIVNQNLVHLKNSFGLGREVFLRLKGIQKMET